MTGRGGGPVVAGGVSGPVDLARAAADLARASNVDFASAHRSMLDVAGLLDVRADNDRLRARVAELEAERDELRASLTERWARARAAGARVAAVEAAIDKVLAELHDAVIHNHGLGPINAAGMIRTLTGSAAQPVESPSGWVGA